MANNKKEGIFSKLARWSTRTFLGQKYEQKWFGNKELGSGEITYKNGVPDDSELIVSPAKQVFQRFIARKFAVFAVLVVVFMFILVFVGPYFMPKYYDAFTESTQKDLPPTMSFMAVPKELKNDINMIDCYGAFSVGLSNAGKVYIWGVTKIGATGFDVKHIPEEVKNANIKFVAAGQDHCVAIDENGKFYGWGSNRFGQYAVTDEILKNDTLIPVPDEVLNGELDVNHIKQVSAGFQATAILMDDGTLYIWGNTQAYANLEKFVGKTNIEEVDFTLNYVVALDKKRDAVYTGYKKSDLYKYIRSSADPSERAVPASDYLGGRKIEHITATLNNICLLLDDGSLAFVGDFGRDNVDVPAAAKNEKFVSVVGGSYHYTGLTEEGNVYTFAGNHYNQDRVPKNLSSKNVTKVFAGAYQSYAVNDNDDLVGKWGLKGYLFGTDGSGANIAERVIAGGKVTMTVGAVAVIIEIIIGVSLGVLSGYFGGWVDMLIMRVCEVVASVPLIPFMLILSSLLAQSAMTTNQKLYMLMFIMGVLGWTGFARITRAQILLARESEYVTAAQSMGVKETRIAFKHILPNVFSVILVNITLAFAGSMGTETTLSYLGFGVIYPQPSWGNMLSRASNATAAINFWWQWLFTSAILILTVVCINTIGDTLRDVMDPKSSNDK
ncbi:MAG: ABC transporter permease subunit [Clostridia bacterium]|nr:ABC transporter permease subunit [Clostridia bacterium]